MKNIKLDLPFFPIEQPGGTFYYTKIPGKHIKDRLIIRNRSKYEDGVQRDLNKSRTHEISEYLSLADAVIPTPLVISVNLKNIKELDSNTITLHTDEDGIFGEIIDGQHRYEGLKKSKNFEESDIPICIFAELSLEDKADIFSTINSTQVKVPKSYIYDLFDYTEENTPIKFCHEVCKTLNYDSSGPLFRRIKMLGKKLNDEETLSQAAFIDALLPLITKNIKEDTARARNRDNLENDSEVPLRHLYISNNITAFSKITTNFLRATRNASGANWENYVLRSIGIKVFARLLGHMAPEGFKNNSLTIDFFFNRLSKIEDIILSCSTKSGTNKGVEDKTVETLITALSHNPPLNNS
ncbi:DGQHR domain-containing protein [Ectopseudomonas khazarica]|uniref:DGQHR domain-containing protein n=1 Tax=Ectopseudomonas khazarica TaxID=2502979 RepID=UPI0040337B09